MAQLTMAHMKHCAIGSPKLAKAHMKKERLAALELGDYPSNWDRSKFRKFNLICQTFVLTFTNIRPETLFVSPSIALRNVDFPAPTGPTMPIKLPFLIAKFNSSAIKNCSMRRIETKNLGSKCSREEEIRVQKTAHLLPTSLKKQLAAWIKLEETQLGFIYVDIKYRDL
uniref:Uncharacterized protein n=1 Tax=Romanomermis culicivorax TaxID=13658 RepID=A0A915JR71_ROMCU